MMEVAFVLFIISIICFSVTSIFSKRRRKKIQKITIPCDNVMRSIPNFNSYLANIFSTPINGTNHYTGCIYIDKVRKKILLVHSDLSYDFYSGRNILGTSMIENGNVVTTGGCSLGGAALGALGLGVAGAIIGGTTGTRTSTNQVKELYMLMQFNDVNYPFVRVNFLVGSSGSIGTTRDSALYQRALNNFRVWESIINIIRVS